MVTAQPQHGVSAELGDSDVLARSLIGKDTSVNAQQSITFRNHLFGIFFRVLAAVAIPFSPLGIHAENHVAAVLKSPTHYVATVEYVRVAADKPFRHVVLGIKQGSEDVVVGPITVVTEFQIGVIGAYHVDLIPAYEYRRFEAGFEQRG